MSTTQDIIWQRGQTEEWVLTVTNADGSASDLTTAISVELEVKPYSGAPDPATLHLAVGAGITVRTQTGADIGVCDVAVTSTQTFGLVAGRWAYDVFVTRSDSARKKTQYGNLTIIDSVNFP